MRTCASCARCWSELEPGAAGGGCLRSRLLLRARLRGDHRGQARSPPARDRRARRARAGEVGAEAVTLRASEYAAAVVTRPLPLQAPTAFVRIRPRGARLCGEARRTTARRCAIRRSPRA